MGITVRNLNIRGRILGKDFIPGPPPAPPPPPVPANSRYNVLLLPGTGTNGGTNNTFIDSSSNNYTITRVGNTTQGSFSPYSTAPGYWSNYFDGNGDFLSVPDSAAVRLATDTPFTIEAFVYFNQIKNSDNGIVGKRQAGYEWQFNVHPSYGYLTFWNGITTYQSNITLTSGRWYHLAVSWDTTTLRFFVDGAMGSTYTGFTVEGSGNQLNIGALLSDGSYGMDGYLSNLRIVKGTALYTSNFTPSTTPLTAVSGTSLLTCQNNRFMDGSSNNFTVTATGNTKVSAYGPFDAASVYNSSTMGGSAYFDGSVDCLSLPSDNNLNITEGAFTIETWIYPTVIGSGNERGIIAQDDGTSSNQSFQFRMSTDGRLQFTYWTSSSRSSAIGVLTTASVSINTWSHVCVSYTGTTLRMFINGIESYSGSIPSMFAANNPTTIGRYGVDYGPSYSFNGYISNIRIIKGTAIYTTNFTPPSAPVTAVSNTQLLLNGTNAAIVDTSAKTDVETLGGAQISTAVSKWGTGSMSFASNSDVIRIPTSDLTLFGTAPFTVEGWVYVTSYTSPYGAIVFGLTKFASNYLLCAITSGGYPQFEYETRGFSGISNIQVPLNTWTHVAWVREGTGTNQFKTYINGVLGFTGTVPANFNDTSVNPSLGNYLHGAGNEMPYRGYMNDIRITKGLARYTGNFTPPTQL